MMLLVGSAVSVKVIFFCIQNIILMEFIISVVIVIVIMVRVKEGVRGNYTPKARLHRSMERWRRLGLVFTVIKVPVSMRGTAKFPKGESSF